MAGLAAITLASAPAPAAAQSSGWHVEPYMLSLSPDKRFVGTVTASNLSDQPIYVRATVDEITLDEQGNRVRTRDADAAVTVFPQEFVLRPFGSFRVRLVGNPARLDKPTKSYYVRFADVSSLQAESRDSGVVTAVTYSFDVLMSVVADAKRLPTSEGLARLPDGKGGYALRNNTGRHVYLQDGLTCPTDKSSLDGCERIAGFPRQSLLPNESVPLAAVASPWLAVVLRSTLNGDEPNSARVVFLRADAQGDGARAEADGGTARLGATGTSAGSPAR